MRENNFDLLRFLFAFQVFLYHAYALSGAKALSALNIPFAADIAVKSFFVVSGFLIFMSYENSRGIQVYFIKRARRIYPAYFFIVLLCTILGGFFSTYVLRDYLSLPLLKYVAANLVFLNFLQPNLPGLFEGNPLQAVNGALWTLKIEVMFYIFVPLAVMAFRKFGHVLMLVTFYVCSVSYSILMQSMAHKTGVGSYLELQRQFPGQIAFFIAGATGYYYLQHLTKYAVWVVALAVTAFALQSWLPWSAIQPLALAVLIVSVACIVPSFGNFAKYGDVSYGIYIVHFPILQFLISYGLFEKSPRIMLFVSATMVLTVALLLWHFIEKPFLRKSSHYVAASHGGSSVA